MVLVATVTGNHLIQTDVTEEAAECLRATATLGEGGVIRVAGLYRGGWGSDRPYESYAVDLVQHHT